MSRHPFLGTPRLPLKSIRPGHLIPGAAFRVLATEGGVADYVERPRVLGRATTLQHVVNTAVETEIFSTTLPANSLGSDGFLQLWLHGNLTSNAGGSVEIIVKLGGVNQAVISFAPANNAVPRGLRVLATLMGHGATNAQTLLVIGDLFSPGNEGVDTTLDVTKVTRNRVVAVDTTVDQTIALAVKWGAASPSSDFWRLGVQAVLLR